MPTTGSTSWRSLPAVAAETLRSSTGGSSSSRSSRAWRTSRAVTFLGDENWLVCPRDLAHELHDERLLPFGVQVYCPDGGGNLRLTYDLRMQAAKSLREDATLCLLWSMLMDSYSRWRTTGDVFSEMGENCDL